MAAKIEVENAIKNLETFQTFEDFNGNHAGRLQLAEAARSLLARIGTPFERAWQLSVTDDSVHAARKVLEDLGLWEGWAKSGQIEASLAELMGFCKVPCEDALLRK